MDPTLVGALVTCLYMPVFGPDDPASTCLTQPQMERRADVLQCVRPDPDSAGSLIALGYIIRGGVRQVDQYSVVAIRAGDLVQGAAYTCIVAKARRRARQAGDTKSTP